MTIHTPTSSAPTEADATPGRLGRIGGAAALLAAGSFGYGIAVFATSLADYTDPDVAPVEAVDFLVDHQGQLLEWYVGIFIVFGAALVPLALALRQRLVGHAPILANVATGFAAIWAALMYATGMVSSIGIQAVADRAATDPADAASVWSRFDDVTNGLGVGSDLAGGIWIGLISIAGLATARLPRWLNAVGAVAAIAGLLSVVAQLDAVETVSGLSLVAWLVGAGVALLRRNERPGALS